jgi:hypothetical protein
MATKLKNGDMSVRITGSVRGHESKNYKATVQKWADRDWELIEEIQDGDFVKLSFRYKRVVLRPTPTALRFGPGQHAPTLPRLERFLTRKEAEQAASDLGENQFIVDETEPVNEE